MKVRATKLSFHEGENGIHQGYWVEGQLLGPLLAGYPLRILREKVNGEERLGLFQSTEMVSVAKSTDKLYNIRTNNSTWMLSILD